MDELATPSRPEIIGTAQTSRTGSPAGDAIAPTSGQYLGPTSSHSFLRRAWRRFGQDIDLESRQDASQDDTPVFLAGDRRVPIQNTANVTLPDETRTSELLARYFQFAAPTYRFLHQPTVQRWLKSYRAQERDPTGEQRLSPIRQAIVLMVLATASLYAVDSSHTRIDTSVEESWETWQSGECFHQAAQEKIRDETGRISIESVQARLASVLYLLNTSRLNGAWYMFGTTVQLVHALGLHRSRVKMVSQSDAIVRECRRRCFWSAFTLDVYLSVMLGRPTMIHDDDIDQLHPESVNDDDITAEGITTHTIPRDSIMDASVCHAKLARIVKESCREQYAVQRPREQQQIATARRLNGEINQWRDRLPVFLSGAIHPASLIPIFRRQHTVLRLARAHAIMLLNRPLILHRNQTQPGKLGSIWRSVVLGNTVERDDAAILQLLALSVIYVYLIQPNNDQSDSHRKSEQGKLYDLAETVQRHLAQATQSNAPSLRYSIILEELQQETRRVLAAEEEPIGDNITATSDTGEGEGPMPWTDLDWETLGGDFSRDVDLFTHLDSFFSGPEAV
ncbi:uncharacterized protein LTR77_008118 [Saxophila tyrrhenica]|uniref:Xylanolytic transcriptional activator regulatory domain-containing protein n=1 Tax=Saxophila tyrrhenica TaxID=1690608 RepID=A0AAV9P1V3_9PEZI|nr:hypothetical protein LTR77_008118 [Saxophila tyrrhenica]